MTRYTLFFAAAGLWLATPAHAQITGRAGFPLDSIRLPVIEPPPPPPAWTKEPVARAPRRPSPPPDTVDHIVITKHGDSVTVRAPLRAGADAAVSEPFRLRDRVRLYLTLSGSRGQRGLAIDAVAGTGLLSVTASESPGATQLLIEAKALRGYQLVTDSAHATLWIAVDTTTQRAAVEPVLVLPTDPVIPRPELPAASDTETGADSGSGQLNPANRVQALKAETAEIAAAARAWLATLTPVFTSTAGLAGAAGVLLLLAALMVVRRKRQRRDPEAPQTPLPAVEAMNDDARVWAARTLAGQGMDASAIARRTGLPRDAAALLVLTARSNFPAAAGSAAGNATGPHLRRAPAGVVTP